MSDVSIFVIGRATVLVAALLGMSAFPLSAAEAKGKATITTFVEARDMEIIAEAFRALRSPRFIDVFSAPSESDANTLAVCGIVRSLTVDNAYDDGVILYGLLGPFDGKRRGFLRLLEDPKLAAEQCRANGYLHAPPI